MPATLAPSTAPTDAASVRSVAVVRLSRSRCRRMTSPSLSAVVGVERTTRAALTEAGRIETPMGQACLALAHRIDFPGLDTGSALAALVARLESSLAVATRGAGATSAPNALRDELAARRAQGA